MLPARDNQFVPLRDALIPHYRGLCVHLKFNQLSSLPPVFVSAALETAILLPKFIGTRPNTLRQLKRFQVKPHCLMNGFAHVCWAGTICSQSKLRRNAPCRQQSFPDRSYLR